MLATLSDPKQMPHRRGLGVRDQVGRLPDRRPRRRRRGRAAHAQGPGLHRALRQRSQGAGQGAEDARLRRRRRGLRARRRGTPELLGDAAGEAGHADRLLRLRPARGGRRAGDRPRTLGAAQAAAQAARRPQPHDPVLGGLRRRPRALRGRAAAPARRNHGQAARLEVPARQALARLAQVQDARRAGVRGRRLHEGQGSPRVVVRLARAGDERARGAGVGRQRRHRLRRRRAGAPAEEAQAARAQDLALPEAAEDAADPQGRRRLGRAEARRRGLVRRVHARPPSARARLPRSARGQGRERGAARDGRADPGRDPQGQARAAALEPRQALLAGGRDHQGRPARVLPGRRAGARSRICATGRSR